MTYISQPHEGPDRTEGSDAAVQKMVPHTVSETQTMVIHISTTLFSFETTTNTQQNNKYPKTVL
jgi:hypothetical protein